MSIDTLQGLGIDLIPQPQQIVPREGAFRPRAGLDIALAEGAEETDRFAAADLARRLRGDWGLEARVITDPAEVRGGSAGPRIVLERDLAVGTGSPAARPEGYRLRVTPEGVTLSAHDAAGLFWGTRTLLQAWRQGSDGVEIPGMEAEDWPDLTWRAIHYDTKHHQDTLEYVQELITTLAGYKVNVLLWEWEDKFAYPRHPEIGAPGAFTLEDLRALTRLARQHHVELVPLVQGLGHVSYILKHPQHAPLREVPDSAWEFCPLREGTYGLLFDLWEEAMEATPGSPFLHIGTDETYELGVGEACGCRSRAAQIGRDGLMRLFLARAAQFVRAHGRQMMTWARAPRQGGEPLAGVVYADSTEVEELESARRAGAQVLCYAPNPGIEPLFLGHFPWVQYSQWRDDVGRVRQGTFRDTADSIRAAARAGLRLGSVTTSWDDSGLHVLAWMPRFACAAEYSWSAAGPPLETWVDRFLRQYFGPQASHLRELFQLLQDGALFYYDTFQRRVWHWGDIGKIHLPDLPRADLEYDPFWRRRYAQLLHLAADQRQRVDGALAILDDNLQRAGRHRYDLEVYRTTAELMRHNADLVLMLGELEGAITAAHQQHFADRLASLAQLRRALGLVEANLRDREQVFGNLVDVWERTRLPKGWEAPGKPYVFAPDRARHFANRTPDMRYLILDEELLDLEGYAGRLREYIAQYERAPELAGRSVTAPSQAATEDGGG
ncbi:MAG: beta-N-acetylhexosaminidase [Candidatus Latescibacterota bacterium]